jgi:hypothetical protein
LIAIQYSTLAKSEDSALCWSGLTSTKAREVAEFKQSRSLVTKADSYTKIRATGKGNFVCFAEEITGDMLGYY